MSKGQAPLDIELPNFWLNQRLRRKSGDFFYGLISKYYFLYFDRTEYINDLIQRKDRLLSEDEAMSLLENGEYGVLSISSPEAGVYGIPINYVWDKQQSIYFHCAPEGHKLCILQDCNQASSCVVGHTRVVSNQFSTEYKSIVINGTMICQLEETEKRKALELLLDKYSPEDKKVGLKYMEKSFHRTHVLKPVIETTSGKCRKMNQSCPDY